MNSIEWIPNELGARILKFKTWDDEGRTPVTYEELFEANQRLLKEISTVPPDQMFHMIYANDCKKSIMDPRLLGLSLVFFKIPNMKYYVITGNLMGIGWLMGVLEGLLKTRFIKRDSEEEAVKFILEFHAALHSATPAV